MAAIALSRTSVTVANPLNEACYSLTLAEKRIILVAIAKVDPTRSDLSPLGKITFNINAKEFAGVYRLSTTHAYTELKTAAKSLYERDIRISDGSFVIAHMRWVSYLEFDDVNNTLYLQWNEGILPYLSNLAKASFTKYKLINVTKLKTVNSIRLYELLVQYQNTQYLRRVITLEEFRFYLDLGTKYPVIKDLISRVITPAVNEVDSNSNIKVKLSYKKVKNKIIAFIFDMSVTQQVIKTWQVEVKLLK